MTTESAFRQGLLRRGVEATSAHLYASALHGIRLEFPEPSAAEIMSGVWHVSTVLWGKQNWSQFFGSPAPSDVASRLDSTAIELATGMIKTGLWPLLGYLDWATRAAFRKIDGNSDDPLNWARYLEKINGILFCNSARSPSNRENLDALATLEVVFDFMDAEALLNQDLARLVEARDSSSYFRSPSRAVFDWTRSYSPTTGMTSEDLEIVHERKMQLIRSAKSVATDSE